MQTKPYTPASCALIRIVYDPRVLKCPGTLCATVDSLVNGFDTHLLRHGFLPCSAGGLSAPFLADASAQAQDSALSAQAKQPSSEEAEQGPSPCQLSAKSLLCAQPLSSMARYRPLFYSLPCFSCSSQAVRWFSGTIPSGLPRCEYISKTAFSVNEKIVLRRLVFKFTEKKMLNIFRGFVFLVLTCAGVAHGRTQDG